MLHTVGERKTLHFVGIIARDAGAGTTENRPRGACGHQSTCVAGKLGAPLPGSFGEILDGDIVPGGVVHGIEHFGGMSEPPRCVYVPEALTMGRSPMRVYPSWSLACLLPP